MQLFKASINQHIFQVHILSQMVFKIFMISTCLVSDRKVHDVSVQITFTWVKDEGEKKTVYGQECVYRMCLTYYAWIADKCTLIWNMIRLETMCLHPDLWRDKRNCGTKILFVVSSYFFVQLEQNVESVMTFIFSSSWVHESVSIHRCESFVFRDWNLGIWLSAKSALIRKVRTPVKITMRKMVLSLLKWSYV